MNQMRKKYDKEFKQKAVELFAHEATPQKLLKNWELTGYCFTDGENNLMNIKNNSFPGHGNPKMTDLERVNALPRKNFEKQR